MTTDTTERGLETLICDELTGHGFDSGVGDPHLIGDRAAAFGAGWVMGEARDYDREYCVDLVQLRAFLEDTQPEVAATLDLVSVHSNTRRQFLARLQGEINKRGTIEVLRNGVNHGPNHITAMYGSPSEQNPTARAQYSRKSVQCDASVAIQPGQYAAGVGSVFVYQWVAGGDVRVEEQSHEADRCRCG